MTWLVWRQHRWDALATAAVVGGLGVVLVVLTLASGNLLSEMASTCASGGPNCGSLQADYQNSFGRYQQYFIGAGVVVPALVGLFIGAPLLAREFEQGTGLLVWTQGITRRRWLLMKVSLTTLAVTMAAILLGAAFQLWIGSQSSVLNAWYEFDVAPPVLVAYTIFALGLGVAAGAVIKRTMPAMAASLAVFVLLRIAISQLIRPYYLPPLLWDVGTNGGAGQSMWVFGSLRYVDPQGHPVSEARFQAVSRAYSDTAGTSILTGKTPPLVSYHDYLKEHGVLMIQQYQPGSRFWLFQGIEMVIFLVLAGLLLAIAYRLVLRSK